MQPGECGRRDVDVPVIEMGDRTLGRKSNRLAKSLSDALGRCFRLGPVRHPCQGSERGRNRHPRRRPCRGDQACDGIDGSIPAADLAVRTVESPEAVQREATAVNLCDSQAFAKQGLDGIAPQLRHSPHLFHHPGEGSASIRSTLLDDVPPWRRSGDAWSTSGQAGWSPGILFPALTPDAVREAVRSRLSELLFPLAGVVVPAPHAVAVRALPFEGTRFLEPMRRQRSDASVRDDEIIEGEPIARQSVP